MKPRLGRTDATLDHAVEAVRGDQPPADAAEAAAARVWSRVAEVAEPHAAVVGRIRGCDDVRALLPEHRAGALGGAKALLVEDHLRDCAACRALRSDPDRPHLAILPWRKAPVAATTAPPPRRWERYAAAAVVALALAASAELVRRAAFAVPPGSRATVESVSGGLQRLSAAGPVALRAGEEVGEADVVRTTTGSQARLRLRDGSTVELGERAEMSVTAGRRDTTIHLERGQVIVQAAKRPSGRLLVASRDCTVQVTGTVFSVNAALRGSRVSVIEGHVRVTKGRQERPLEPGDQWASNDAMGTVPLRDEIAWSRDLDRHLALLAEVQALRQKLQEVRLPGLRYESRILGRLPARTFVFASVPNYGEALGQAHRLFQERLQESAVLREWWQEADPARSGGPSLESVIERVRTLADFLGDEVVLAVVEDGQGRPVPLLLAEVRRPGLQEFVDQQLADLPRFDAPRPPVRVHVRQDLVVVAGDAEAHALIGEAAAEGGLPSTPFGHRIGQAYGDGAGLLFAADLERIGASSVAHGHQGPQQGATLRAAGFDALRHFIVESKDVDGQSQSHAVLAFAGARRGVASWLAAPAPMGALEFFSPNAQAVAAFVAKSPALVLDDILGVAGAHNPAAARKELTEIESKLDLRLREDVALTLGGEFAFALDGPLLPTPAWKAIVEVTDADRLQSSLLTLVSRANDEAARAGRPALRLESEQTGGRTCHVLRGAGLPFELHYAFADGYLVAAPSRALVLQAIHTRDTGQTLGGSEAFRALFPRDGRSHVSALVYQNLGGTLGGLLDGARAISPEQRGAVEALARGSRPTLMCAYGDDDAIQVASMGGLLDFDAGQLALPMLLERAMPGTPKAGTP